MLMNRSMTVRTDDDEIVETRHRFADDVQGHDMVNVKDVVARTVDLFSIELADLASERAIARKNFCAFCGDEPCVTLSHEVHPKYETTFTTLSRRLVDIGVTGSQIRASCSNGRR